MFRAYDRQAVSEPWVAVKVAPFKSETSKEMFRREGRAAAILAEHPQYFVGFRGSDFNDPAYLVLDFVPWPTLTKMRALEGNLPPLDVARLGVEILRGVRCMERRKMVHRDIKPDNIFARCCDDGSFEVKIADLGIWVDAGASEESLLGRLDDTKYFFGTPPYMSPEQIRGDVLTAASDVHAVASVLWQLQSGTLPFPMKPGVSIEEKLVDRLQQCRLQPLRPPSMPEELYLILTTALRFNPEERVFVDPQTLAGSENPANDSAPRGMEKALRRFVDDYGERRKRSMVEKAIKVQLLEATLTSGEKKIATAQKLSAKADDFRARLDRLNNESTGFDDVLEGLRAMESQVEGWYAAVEDFVDARRSEIDEARRGAEAEAKRADEWEKKAKYLQARMDGAIVEGRSLSAEARAAEDPSQPYDADLRQRGAVPRRLLQPVFSASLAVIGLCVGFGLSSLVHSGLPSPSPQAHAQVETSAVPSVATAVTTAAAPSASTSTRSAAAPPSSNTAEGQAGGAAPPTGTVEVQAGGQDRKAPDPSSTSSTGPQPLRSSSSSTGPAPPTTNPDPYPTGGPKPPAAGGKIVKGVREE